MAWVFFVGLVAIVLVQLATGRAGARGGRSVERVRNPQGFWLVIAFEIAMLALLAAGLVRGFAR